MLVPVLPPRGARQNERSTKEQQSRVALAVSCEKRRWHHAREKFNVDEPISERSRNAAFLEPARRHSKAEGTGVSEVGIARRTCACALCPLCI